MRILSRYILREVLSFFSISLAAFTGLLLTVKMLRLTSLIVNRGVEPLQIVRVFLAIIPTFLEIALPMSALLGVMLAFSRLSGDSEVIVMRASGISLFRFVRPLAYFAVGIGIAGLFVSLVLRPWGFASLSDALFDAARSRSTAGLTEGVFNKLGNIILYAEEIDYSTGDLSRIIIDDKRNPEQRKIVIAKRGRIIADEAQQSLSLLLADGVAHELINGRYARTDFTTNSLGIDSADLSNDSGKGVNARELQSPELIETIHTYEQLLSTTPEQDHYSVMGAELSKKELEKKLRRARIELGQRFSLPYASFIMTFIGMSFGIMSPRTQRTWGAGFAAALGLGVFIVYYSIFSVSLALADSGALNAWVALWIPNVLATIVAITTINKIGTEQWQSVSEALYIKIMEFAAGFKHRWRRA